MLILYVLYISISKQTRIGKGDWLSHLQGQSQHHEQRWEEEGEEEFPIL